MLKYNKITLGKIIDEIEIRMGDALSSTNLDFQTLAMFVNRSVREVQYRFMPYKEWAYISTLKITSNPMPLPAGENWGEHFVDVVRVMLPYHFAPTSVNPAGGDTYVEARYASAKEFFELSEYRTQHNWNKATFQNPIYTIWGGIDLPWVDNDDNPINSRIQEDTHDRLYLYLAPYDHTVFANCPSTILGYDLNDGGTPSHTGYMDCVLTPKYLKDADDIVTIPAECESLVIMGAMVRALEKVGNLDKLSESIMNINEEYQNMAKMFYMDKIGDFIALESQDNPDMTKQQGGQDAQQQ